MNKAFKSGKLLLTLTAVVLLLAMLFVSCDSTPVETASPTLHA